jgi:uncharacterized membrane protein
VTALFFGHLLGAFAFVGGAIVSTAAYEAARRRDDPAAIAALLALARVGVLLVAAGGLAVVGFGSALVAVGEFDFGAPWLSGSFALFLLAALLGAFGGQTPKQARLRATELAREHRPLDAELRRLLDDRLALVLNGVTGLIVLAILALMVWQPGA